MKQRRSRFLRELSVSIAVAMGELGWKRVLIGIIASIPVLIGLSSHGGEEGFVRGYQTVAVLGGLAVAGNLFAGEQRSRRFSVLRSSGLHPGAYSLGLLFVRGAVIYCCSIAIGIIVWNVLGLPATSHSGLFIVVLPLECLGIFLLASLYSILLPGWANILGAIAHIAVIGMLSSLLLAYSTSSVLRIVGWCIRLTIPELGVVGTDASGAAYLSRNWEYYVVRGVVWDVAIICIMVKMFSVGSSRPGWMWKLLRVQ